MAYKVVPRSHQVNYPVVPAKPMALIPAQPFQLNRASVPQQWPMVEYTQGAFTQNAQRLKAIGSSLRNLGQYPVAVIDPKTAEMWSKLAKRETDRLRHISNLTALGLLKVLKTVANGCKSATNKMGELAGRCVERLLGSSHEPPVKEVSTLAMQKLPRSVPLSEDLSKKRVVIHLSFTAPVSKLPLHLRLGIKVV